RDYSWTDQEWDDLWVDIQELLSPEGEPAHYMGYLVLQSHNNKAFDIIDGQQRITTLSLFVLALLNNLKKLIDEGVDPENNQKRADQLRNSFIGYLDPVSLVPTSKLTLNRNNDSFYQNYIVPLQKLPKRNLKATEHRMRKAFEWFDRKINQAYTNKKDGSLLAGIIDQLSDKLFFTVITVDDELNAYKVFETLNARGVKLSSTDLLKNYLFSVVDRGKQDPRELENLDERWEKLLGKLGSESFPEFLRAHWNSKNKMARASELFKRIRFTIKDRQAVFELVRDMELDADTYAALSNPEDTLWEADQRVYIGELRMFSVRQLYPLLLSAYRKLDAPDFTRLLKACSIISFRYNVIGSLPANEQERIYTKTAVDISSGDLQNLADILHQLRSLYPDDTAFVTAFQEKRLRTTQSRNKRIVRYILFSIEKQYSQNDYDMDSDKYDIEHILPENPEENWPQFSDADHESALYRLGNMTLLTSSKNRDLGNAGYNEKRPVFAESNFHITKKIAEDNAEWIADRIAAHQRWMANQAKGIWRINQLS
ncbi:MAG TPA: DUF262 domain-containing HNH endonuclease family protein, partial [Cryomorphaceae bacterium]|nr:DUF262 domain-containing HNH endonuclease family protein [Cryomorphaceae bacterium]